MSFASIRPLLSLLCVVALTACAQGRGGYSLDGGPTGDLVRTPDVSLDVDDGNVADQPKADLPEGGCRRDDDCTADPAGTFCETSTGRCVECLPSRPSCRAGTYCVAESHTCQTGCNTDDDCGTGGVTRCDMAQHRCVGCTGDSECSLGTVCQAGTCVPGCNEQHGCGVGNACCSGMCVDTNASALHCGACGMACAAGATCCTGACIDTRSTASHCGRCGNACNIPGATAVCTSGTCQVDRCAAGFGNCDGNAANGCETPVTADPANCGTCGTRCEGGPSATGRCANGQCSTECATGFGNCDGNAANGCETRLSDSPSHCGACGQVCPIGTNAVARCTGGVCGTTCATGFGDCDNDPSNGCEVNLQTSPTSCGACGVTCTAPNATPTCTSGVCSVGICRAGFANCDGRVDNGCETATTADNANCGGCGVRCGAGTTCSNGACSSVCTGGTTFCTDRCIDLRTDASHCGGCGQACGTVNNASSVCDQGTCGLRCNPGFGNCFGGNADGCETDLRASTDHCGACGAICQRSNAMATCGEGVCRVTLCNQGFDNCNGNDADGCETSIVSDTRNCGGCGRVCVRSNAVPMCTSGVCSIAACTGGYANCNGIDADGCETLTLNDNNHCGACNRACGAGTACSGGTCASVCSGGTVYCAGSCVSLQSDARNCGACGNVCPSGRSCVSGVCVDPAPSNDRCSGAIDISLAQSQTTFQANVTGANRDLAATCTTSGADVFYRFTLSAREFVYADTFGTGFDTVLYFASGCTTTMPSTTTGDATCSDDTCGTVQSQVVALLNPGTYYLVVAGYSSNVGTINVRFQHLPAGNGAVGALQAGASSWTGTTAGTSGTAGCAGSGPENTYWWRTCPAETGGTLTATTCNRASWDTVLYARNGDGGGGACNDDGCGVQSNLSAPITAGAGLHTLTLDGYYSDSRGSYTVAITRP